MNLKNQLIGALTSIHANSQDSEFSGVELDVIADDFKIVQDYFGITRNQAIILAIIFAQTCKGRTIEAADVIGHTGSEPMQLLNYSDDFQELNRRNIISVSNSRQRSRRTIVSDNYSVNHEIIKAISQSQPMPSLNGHKCLNVLELLDTVNELSSDMWSEDYIDIPVELQRILESNQELSLVKHFEAWQLTPDEVFIFCVLSWRLLNGDNSTNLIDTLERFYQKRKLDRLRAVQKVLHSQSRLTQLDLVKLETEEFYHSPVLSATDKLIAILADEGLKITAGKKVKNKNVITPDEIVKKELFYNPEELKQIELLTDCLTDAGFRRTQKKLLANGMPPGIIGLLYGPPGTGKTELVYQIARKTGRDIFPVDCTAIRDKFFGASESKLNEVFRTYEAYCATASRAGILMLNEGDQLLGSRQQLSSGSHSITQTENNLVNLMLENFERNKNIILITSNMPQNMDFAVQRRILFRISIQQGSPAIQAKIWKARLKNLSDELCKSLSNYNLSGGSIENIIRKHLLNSVLNKDNNLQNLLEYAQQESQTWGEKKNKIGY